MMRAKIIQGSFLKGLVSAETRSAMKEKLSHRKELQKMLTQWKKIKIPVVYLQSEKDSVVYPSNGRFARDQMTRVPAMHVHFFEGGKHDIAASHEPLIRDKIIELYQEL